MSILFRAQNEIIQGLLENRGDALIRTPNMIWRQGKLYVTVNHHLELRWSVLAEALDGIFNFFGAFYDTTCSVTIFDAKAGILGEIIVGMGY